MLHAKSSYLADASRLWGGSERNIPSHEDAREPHKDARSEGATSPDDTQTDSSAERGSTCRRIAPRTDHSGGARLPKYPANGTAHGLYDRLLQMYECNQTRIGIGRGTNWRLVISKKVNSLPAKFGR